MTHRPAGSDAAAAVTAAGSTAGTPRRFTPHATPSATATTRPSPSTFCSKNHSGSSQSAPSRLVGTSVRRIGVGTQARSLVVDPDAIPPAWAVPGPTRTLRRSSTPEGR
jgi:hypothetical protein